MKKELMLPLKELAELETTLRKKHKEISDRKTPKAHVKRRPDGMDYLEEGYMRQEGLNKNFPIWSWSPIKHNPVQFLGSEWAVVSGVLEVVDEGVPRKFFSPGAARIQFKRGTPHTPENVIDIDKNVASANTNAFKRAINRLTNFGDDIYRKQIEDLSLTDEDMDTVNSLLGQINDADTTNDVLSAIEDGRINKSNVNQTLRYLTKQTEGEE